MLDREVINRNVSHKWKNRVKAFLQKPANVILVTFIVILSILTLYPLVSLVIETFVVHPMEVMSIGKPKNSFTLFHWKKLFGSGEYSSIKFFEPFMNTISMAIIASIVAILFGGIVAWLITRTNIRGKKFISAVFVFPYIMPSWTLAMFWGNFFRNSNVGSGITGLFTALTGIMMPEWFVYGLFPTAIVLGLHYAPFAYILIGGILRNMDANLEEAATILKASRGKIMRRITLPIVMPALLSTFLLVFASSMSAYAVPVFLGSPVRFWVLTTQMFSMMNGSAQGQGYIIAFIMILLGVGILGLNQWFTGRRKSFTTVTGKSSQISLIDLKKGKTIIAWILVILLLCVAILPLITFALESVMMKTGEYSWSNFTLDFWIGRGDSALGNGMEAGILMNKEVWTTLFNSVLLSVVCALVAGTCGILIGYAIVKRRGSKLSTFVNNLAFFPYLMPSMAFGAIYLSMSTKINFLYGTFFILALIGSVKYLPFASRSGVNAMLQLSNEIEEAAIIVAVPWWKRMTKVIVPIQKASFLSGYLLPFISCMRELSLFALLVTPQNRVLTTMLMQFNEKGYTQYGNAINLMIIVVVLIVNFVVNKATGASIDKGVGG
ncbi:MAG: iron ABC transporter permease [Clostridia bacterium]